MEFNIGSPKQLGDVLFNKLALPMPVKYGKGKKISTAVDVMEGLAAEHEVPRMVLEYRQLTKLKSTYVDALPRADSQPKRARAYNIRTDRHGHGQTVVGESQSAEYSRFAPNSAAKFAPPSSPSRATSCWPRTIRRSSCACWRTTLKTNCWWRRFGAAEDIHTLTASQVFGVPPLMVTPDHRRQAKVVNFGIVYGLSAFGLSQKLGH